MSHAFIPSSNSPVGYNVAVTSSSGAVLQNNPIARYRSFKNCSQTTAIWLGLGVPAVVGAGICLEPRGTYEMAYVSQNMYPNEIFAISEGATTTIAILEAAPNI